MAHGNESKKMSSPTSRSIQCALRNTDAEQSKCSPRRKTRMLRQRCVFSWIPCHALVEYQHPNQQEFVRITGSAISSQLQHRELDNLDGEPFVLEWIIFPGHTTKQFLGKKKFKFQAPNFENRIMFMSLCNDIGWTARNTASSCEKNSSDVSEYAEKFPVGHWSFVRRKLVRTLAYVPEEH